jgi:hypothetical protein
VGCLDGRKLDRHKKNENPRMRPTKSRQRLINRCEHGRKSDRVIAGLIVYVWFGK